MSFCILKHLSFVGKCGFLCVVAGGNFLRRPRNKYVAQQPMSTPPAQSPPNLVLAGLPYSPGGGAEIPLSPPAVLQSPSSVYGTPISSAGTNSASPTNHHQSSSSSSSVTSMFSSASSLPFGTSSEDLKLTSVNLQPPPLQQPSNTSAILQPTSAGAEAGYSSSSSPLQSTVIPASFENMVNFYSFQIRLLR